MKKTIVVDATQINLIQSCHYKWYLSQVRNLVPKGSTPVHFEKGSLMHEMLKKLYRSGELPYEVRIDSAVEEGRLFSATTDLPGDIIEEEIAIFRNYCDYWKGDSWVPLAVEQPFSRVFYEDEELRIVLEGIPDLIVEVQGKIIPVDHKTMSRRSIPNPLMNQMFAYCWALETDFGIINQIGLQKMKMEPSERFKRPTLSYSKANIEAWRKNVVRTVRDLVFSIEVGEFPQNYTSCDKYSGCMYTSLCMTDPDARAWKAQMDFMPGRRWDPLRRDKEMALNKEE